MPDANLDLAPPARDVDGLHAVPIDIQSISAHRDLLRRTKETFRQPGLSAQLEIPSTAGFPLWIGVHIQTPANAVAGQSLLFDLVQLDDQKRPEGGVAVQMFIKA